MPGMRLSSSSSLSGSLMGILCTSMILWPLSVVKFKRNCGLPPYLSSWRDTSERAAGMISIGSGNLPSRETYLLSSTMQTNFSAALATIFSANSAPPPPLIICRLWLTSSAPSIYTGSSVASVSGTSGMPCCFKSSLVALEVETAPLMRMPLLASSSMKKFTVLPVPMPM